jgi:RND family efflux transporter MFP subunit
MKKLFIAILILAGLGFLGWQIFEKATGTKTQKRRRRSNPPVAVEIAPVQKTTIIEIGRFAGSLNPKSEFVVAPKIAGRLEKISINIGDTVNPGMLLVKLYDQEYLQQQGQAQAELEVAVANLAERRTTLENAKRELDRTETLHQKKIASESELDTARSTFKAQQAKLNVALAQVKQKKAALATVNVRLSYTKIHMPKNGGQGYWVVGERFVDVGAMLMANTRIASVLDIGTLTGVIFVIERDYPKIHTKLEALIATDAFPGQTFPGRVVRIAPMMNETSREARVEIEIPNKTHLLKPGMFVRVEIEFDQHKDATVVPTAAIIKRNGTKGLFLADIENKRAAFVPVIIGIVNGPKTEIIKPPISGSVVTLGHHLLADGAPIVLPKQRADAAPGKNRGPKSGAKFKPGRPSSGGGKKR